MRTAALTCRSYYSLLRGAVSVQRLVRKAAEYGYDAVALADVNAMYGVADFCASARAAGIKPIVGAEVLTGTRRVILLAENRAGYENLCRIITARNLEPSFDLAERLSRHNEGLICICPQHALARQLRKRFPAGQLFAGCRDASEAERAEAEKLSPVAFGDFNCIDQADTATTRLLERIRRMSTAGPGPQDGCRLNGLVPREEFSSRFRDYPQAIRNAEQLILRCDLQLLNSPYLLPRARLAGKRSADSELSRLCHRALAAKYNPLRNEIVRRLEHELAVIRGNEFSDYFLVVHSIVDFARRKGIPVEVRGSAAGSLVAHLLGFTRVCPIAENLYFERFMNPGRKDCPDIDIDFCWRRRDEVIDFCYEHWGRDNVAMICNINRYRRRGALRDVGRFLQLGRRQVSELVNARNPKRDSPLYKLAESLIGIPRHIGVHCGGIVIAPRALSRIAPLERATKGVVITQYDKRAAEALGLVKIDLLSNRALSTVDQAVRLIRSSGRSIDIDAVDPGDRETADLLTAGESLGVFQCESPGMRQLLRGLTVRDKKDAAIALSLIRPGPASGGTKSEFIQRHLNNKPFEYLHPKMQEVLGQTHGVMLYQEDVMRIAVEVAGYSLAEANQFRTEVSSNVPAGRLQQQYVDFLYAKAERQGIDRETAGAIWERILSFAAYSYCKAHATVYANIAWQTAFLKAHYPLQFYTSLFNNHHGMYPLRVYVWEAIRHGIRVLPPHVNHSDTEWSLQAKTIRAGLNIIKGLGRDAMIGIVRQRKRRPFSDLDDLRRRVRLSRAALRNLVHVGACDGLAPSRPAMLMQLHTESANPRQLLLFDSRDRSVAGTIPEYDRLAKLKAEVDVTGIPFSMHPAILLGIKHTPARRLAKFIGGQVTVAGFIAAARRAKTNDGRTMGFVTLEDSSGLAEVTFFPDRIETYKDLCSTGGPVWVRGKVAEHLSSLTVEGRDWGPAA